MGATCHICKTSYRTVDQLLNDTCGEGVNEHMATRGRPRKSAQPSTKPARVKEDVILKYMGKDLTLVQIDEKLDLIIGILKNS